ncbi:hypothetical protein HR16_04470 [Porphyromonas gulae]|nr:hypothetical protein HR16_04470 [Porphyromonas gulae]
MGKPMNRIKEILERKVSSKHGLPKNSARASVFSIPMSAIDANQASNFYLKLLRNNRSIPQI